MHAYYFSPSYYRPARRAHPARLPAFGDHAIGLWTNILASHDALYVAQPPPQLDRVKKHVDRLAYHLPDRVAGRPLDGRADVGDDAVLDRVDHLLDVFHQVAVLGLAFL